MPYTTTTIVNTSIEARMVELEEAVHTLTVKLNTTLEAIDKLLDEAGPLIDSLSGSPILKMLGGK